MNQPAIKGSDNENRILMLLIRTESIIARNKCFSFTLLSLVSLILAWLNLELNSSFIGILAFLVFFVPLSIFTGRVFFKEENLKFRLIFGFVTLLAIMAFFGTSTYLCVDYSWPPMLALLVALTLTLSFLNNRTKQHLECSVKNKSSGESKIEGWKLCTLDSVFVLCIILSIYAIYVGRTGESITTFWDVIDSTAFFLPYFGASSIAVLTVVSHKAYTKRALLYVVLLALVAALVPIIALENPQTHMMSTNIAWTRHFDEFGRFVSEPWHIERASASVHKHLEFTGYNVIVVTLSRILGIDPALLNVLLTPLLFVFFVPLSAFFLVKIVFPNRPKVALLSALALLISQHNLFLFIPPGKPETLGLVFLLLSIVFWIRYLVRKEKTVFSFIFTPILFSVATVLSHPNVGVFAIALGFVSIYLRVLRPFETSNRQFSFDLLSKLGFVVITVVLSISLILMYQISNFLKVTSLPLTPVFDVGAWMNMLFPPFDSLHVFSLEGLRDLYLNNFTYVWYALILGGIFFSYRWKVNPKLRYLIIPLISMALTSMILQQFFFPTFWDREYYRFFCYFNFITFPFAGFSLYALTKSLSARIYLQSPRKIGRKLRNVISWKLVWVTIKPAVVVLLISCMVIAALYGGLPRNGSLGPYTASSPMFVSKYDMSVMEFISERESKVDRAFFIVGDSDTAGAALLTFGYKVYSINGTFPTFVSYGTAQGRNVWDETLRTPSPVVLDNALSVLKADALYLVLTNRVGDNLQDIVETYMSYLLEPVFSIPEKIFVFEYTAETYKDRFPIMLAEDEPSEFWRVEMLGDGTIDITLDEDHVERIYKESSLRLSTTQGKYARFNLQHEFKLTQDWSTHDFLSLYLCGTSSQIRMMISVATSDTDFFVYTFKDEFIGWHRLIIPLQEFESEGKPRWSEIKSMRIHFASSPVPIDPGLILRIDKIAVDVINEAKIEASEYERQAVRFIMSTEEKLDDDFRIIGDLNVAAATRSEFGNLSCWIYYPTDWEMQFFIEPLTKITSNGISRTYIVINNRLNDDLFHTLVDTAHVFLDEPVFHIAGNIYVYQYLPIETITYLANDDHSSFWTPIAWGVNGSIGTPDISLDTSTTVNGVNSLKLTITNGNFSHWGLSHLYEEPLDWSSAHSIGFWWCGQSSGKVINVYILAPDGKNTFIANIRENWSGWREIVLPWGLFESYGEPSWAKVTYVRIGMYDSPYGIWNLNDVTLQRLSVHIE